MCHILCFLTGAGLATYLARRRHRHEPLYDDEEDVYYGDRMREREGNAASSGNPDTNNVRGIEQVDRTQQQGQDLQQEARGTGEGGKFHKSLSKVTKPLVEFFQNVGDALDEAARERQARRTTTATTTTDAPQPQTMAEKSPLPEMGEKQKGERDHTPRA